MGTFRRGEDMRIVTWWKGLSSVVRWLLVTITIMALAGGSVLAYTALTGTGEVTVNECLSWVGENTFNVSLYPQEVKVVNLTLANVSSVAIEVEITSDVSPRPKGLTVDIPSSIIVPAVGQQMFSITITADKDAEPNTYTVEFEIAR